MRLSLRPAVPYTPQQNEMAKTKNRTPRDMMNAMLVNSRLPDNMWGYAILSACHVLNKVPHSCKISVITVQ